MNVGELKLGLVAACDALELDVEKDSLRVLWGDLSRLGRGLVPMHGPVIDRVAHVYRDESSLVLVMSEYGNEPLVTLRALLDEASRMDVRAKVLVEDTRCLDEPLCTAVDGMLVDGEKREIFLHPRTCDEFGNTCDQDASTWRYGSVRIFTFV